jgi:hypothetical protein
MLFTGEYFQTTFLKINKVICNKPRVGIQEEKMQAVINAKVNNIKFKLKVDNKKSPDRG